MLVQNQSLTVPNLLAGTLPLTPKRSLRNGLLLSLSHPYSAFRILHLTIPQSEGKRPFQNNRGLEEGFIPARSRPLISATVAMAVALLTAVAALASYLPARRTDRRPSRNGSP